jgi:hypothetical protein
MVKNHLLPRHNTAAVRELPEDLPQELWTAKCVWVRCCGLVPPLIDGLYSVLQLSLRHFKRQMGDREDFPPPASSPAQATPPWHPRHTAGPGGSHPLLPCRPSPTASPSSLHHRRQKLTLKNCFSWDACQVFSTPREGIIKLLPAIGSWTTSSLLLTATKKLGGALWAPPADPAYAPRRITSTARDDQPLLFRR